MNKAMKNKDMKNKTLPMASVPDTSGLPLQVNNFAGKKTHFDFD